MLCIYTRTLTKTLNIIIQNYHVLPPTVTELVVANRFMQRISAGDNLAQLSGAMQSKSILECDESRNYNGDLEDYDEEKLQT